MASITTRAGKGSPLTNAEVDANFTNLNSESAGTVLTAQGDLLYASAANTPARLAKNTSATRYLSNTGANNDPAWAQIDLSNGITGTLPVANGGTGITSFGTGIATWLGTPSSANLASAVTDETGSGALVFGTGPTIGTASLNRSLVKTTKEVITVSATAATGTINFDAITQSVLYYTTDASGNWTLNVRGDGSNSLDSIMSTGESITVAFLATQGGTAYYQSAFQVDGSGVTPKWQGGSAPTEGNTSGIDTYVINIIKTGSATFTALASITQFA